MAIFGHETIGQPLWKNVKERRLSTLEYGKRHFSGLYFLKKKMLEKWPFLDQNHRLTHLDVNFSTFWTSCFYSLESRLFALEYHNDIFQAYIA